MNFKDKGAYQRWLAYGHMHGAFEAKKGNQQVTIGGRQHKVCHKKN